MTVLLVILTFAAFIALDLLLSRREGQRKTASIRGRVSIAPAPAPVWVAGYELPEDRSYHAGHTWARVLPDDTVAIGMDDFARRLVGRAERVALPAVGTWLQQGEAGFGVGQDGREARFVSPVEGEVVEVNPALLEEPRLATDDPYGRGWFARLRGGDTPRGLRNLLSGSLARRFMEDAREGLDLRLMALSGSVLQDGGEPVADFARHLPDEDWKRLVSDFFLT
jgi:glycine cleavage system H protein